MLLPGSWMRLKPQGAGRRQVASIDQLLEVGPQVIADRELLQLGAPVTVFEAEIRLGEEDRDLVRQLRGLAHPVQPGVIVACRREAAPGLVRMQEGHGRVQAGREEELALLPRERLAALVEVGLLLLDLLLLLQDRVDQADEGQAREEGVDRAEGVAEL